MSAELVLKATCGDLESTLKINTANQWDEQNARNWLWHVMYQVMEHHRQPATIAPDADISPERRASIQKALDSLNKMRGV